MSNHITYACVLCVLCPVCVCIWHFHFIITLARIYLGIMALGTIFRHLQMYRYHFAEHTNTNLNQGHPQRTFVHNAMSINYNLHACIQWGGCWWWFVVFVVLVFSLSRTQCQSYRCLCGCCMVCATQKPYIASSSVIHYHYHAVLVPCVCVFWPCVKGRNYFTCKWCAYSESDCHIVVYEWVFSHTAIQHIACAVALDYLLAESMSATPLLMYTCEYRRCWLQNLHGYFLFFLHPEPTHRFIAHRP